MQVLVIRHGRAGERAAFAATGESDDLRPLTAQGRSRTKEAAAGLARQVEEIDALVTSPLVRAAQTAEIVAQAYPAVHLEELPALAPGGSPERVAEWLQEQPPDACVALVGHEPDLSTLVSWLMTGKKRPCVVLKKGAAALLEVPHPVRSGTATLLWLLGARQLGALGS